jgi:hypothetical protein
LTDSALLKPVLVEVILWHVGQAGKATGRVLVEMPPHGLVV